MHLRNLISSALSLSFALVLALGATLPSQNYSGVVALGDSLFALIGSPGKPYSGGRFSDGPICVEQIAEVLGKNLDSLAIGGSTTSDVLDKQVKPFVLKAKGKLPSDSLYVYWAGANDLLDLLSNQSGNPTVVIGNAMNKTATSLATLIGAGARHVMVLNLPDLSKTPRVIAIGDPVTSAGAQALAKAYNQALAATISYVEGLTKVDIIEVDVFGLTQAIAADPWKYMFRVVDEPRMRSDGSVRDPANRFLFFDDIHPTFSGHRAIMRAMLHAMGRPIPGDANGDFVVNLRDLDTMGHLRGPCSKDCPADLNNDGQVDQTDTRLLVQMLAPR